MLNEIFEKYKKTVPYQDKLSLFQIMQIDELKHNTEALNKANEVVENLLNEAALLTVRRDKTAITMAEIDEAHDRVLMGPAKVTKKYTETDFLKTIYEAQYYDDMKLVILDEMNIARVEYYFADFLSIMEMPSMDEWIIEIINTLNKGEI